WNVIKSEGSAVGHEVSHDLIVQENCTGTSSFSMTNAESPIHLSCLGVCNGLDIVHIPGQSFAGPKASTFEQPYDEAVSDGSQKVHLCHFRTLFDTAIDGLQKFIGERPHNVFRARC